jgi:hypothetical protein
MASLSSRKRSKTGQLLPDPEVDALIDGRVNNDPHMSAEDREKYRQLANAARERKYREKLQRKVIQTDKHLPGMSPSPFDQQQLKPKERHAQTEQAIERARGAVNLVFDFTENLIRAGNEAVDKIRAGKEVNQAEIQVVTEARLAANKLIDKVVPDIMAEGAKGGQVHINFGAPLARLMQTGATTIELTPSDTPTEDTPDGTRSDQLHAASIRDSDSRQPDEN